MDIDTDFRCDIKDVLLCYLKLKYGERAISQILTKSYLQGKSAIDKVVMILGSRDTIDRQNRFDKGEKMNDGEVAYPKDKEPYVIPADYRSIGEKLKKKNGVDFTKSLKENEKALLNGANTDIEREIVETAILMDGNLDHTGLHAAGCIISDNNDLAEYIPVAWDVGFQTWKTQCDMVQCESMHGLLKMDLLLLKTLDIITYAIRLIQERTGKVIDIENLPLEKEVFQSIYATGNTKSVFQFESSGMMKVLKQLNPTGIEDIIAANAMYRPGPMDSIPDYIEAKRSGKIVYDCPELEPILSGTYGQIVYQEQVMRIVRDLAGYSLGRSDLVRRAMAKKHMDELVAERKNFVYGNADEGIHGCVAIGIDEKVANGIFDKMLSFASYAFNKSHAAAYSVTSYMTAYLKHYYPTEFYVAVLNYTEKLDDIPSIIVDAKENGVKLLPPDINKSMSKFTAEGNAIRFGLGFLRGAKTRADSVVDARECGFSSFKSFVSCNPGKAFAEAAIYSGALDSLAPEGKNGRAALLAAYAELSAMDAQSDEFADYHIPNVQPFDMMARLQKEREYTSLYLTGNPLDHYFIDTKLYRGISELEVGRPCWIAGAISDERVIKTKSSGANMMSGKISDAHGSMIDFIIFPKAYAALPKAMDVVMAFEGKLMEKDDEIQFVVENARFLPKKQKQLLVWADDYKQMTSFLERNTVAAGQGMRVFLVGKNQKIYPSRFFVTEQFCIDNHLKYSLQELTQ